MELIEYERTRKIASMVEEARENLSSFKFEEARSLYLSILSLYNGLDDKTKVEVYPQIKELYEERMAAEQVHSSSLASKPAMESMPVESGKMQKPKIEPIKLNRLGEEKPVIWVPKEEEEDEFIRTGIQGLDTLFEKGIPRGSSVIVAGGAGSGKTILSLQLMANHAARGEKCLYISLEESEHRLMRHMKDFGWNPKELINSGNLVIKRLNPFDIMRSVDALLMRAKGELLIDVEPIIFNIFTDGFIPDIIVVDSLTALASAFSGKDENYRIYIEQLFRLFEKMEATSFLITETKQIPTIFSPTGVEEFLADGVIVFYNIKRGNVRENAVEVLKLRGAKHQKKIVAMQITDKGIVVYPEQEVFSSIEE